MIDDDEPPRAPKPTMPAIFWGLMSILVIALFVLLLGWLKSG
jgi:hypothetical protein